jgi:hypothetical protein
MFAVQEGNRLSPCRSQRGVNQGPKIVGVHDMRTQAENAHRQANDSRGRKPRGFTEESYVLGLRKAVRKSAATLKAGHVGFDPARSEACRDIYHTVFHAARLQRMYDV